jgi:FkbM family methyltransferase
MTADIEADGRRGTPAAQDGTGTPRARRPVLDASADLVWRLRLGRCGPVARRLARFARRALPVRGNILLTNVLLGEPPAQRPCAVDGSVEGTPVRLDLREALHRVVYLDLFDVELRRTVLPLLTPGHRFVDVGANFGFWALAAARQGCEVIACEPIPETRALLRANAARGGFAPHIVDAAITDTARAAGSGKAGSRVTMGVPHGESGHARIGAPAGDGPPIDVRAMTLDELIGPDPVRMLKIDVEGHEASVLRSGAAVLSRGRIDYILIELVDDHLVRAGSSVAKVIAMLEAHGYVLERFVRENEGLFPRRRPVSGWRPDLGPGDALWRHRSVPAAPAERSRSACR